MKVKDIIKQVRWSVDEESGYGDFEDTYFDNIVKAKIGASLRWCALYADLALSSSKDSGSSDVTFGTDYTIPVTGSSSGSSPSGVQYDGVKTLTLPGTALKVNRVRVSSWSKGVSTLISEDSGEYLMQSDATSYATTDRPVAALIQTNPLKVELFPTPSKGDTIEISIVNDPVSGSEYDSETTDETDINVPSKLRGAFIYYLAYLVMCAHTDSTKASMMLTIAKQQIAASND